LRRVCFMSGIGVQENV